MNSYYDNSTPTHAFYVGPDRHSEGILLYSTFMWYAHLDILKDRDILKKQDELRKQIDVSTWGDYDIWYVRQDSSISVSHRHRHGQWCFGKIGEGALTLSGPGVITRAQPVPAGSPSELYAEARHLISWLSG